MKHGHGLTDEDYNEAAKGWDEGLLAKLFIDAERIGPRPQLVELVEFLIERMTEKANEADAANS